MKTLVYGFVLVYLFALPFYLLFPVTNVYTHYGGQSALEIVIPSVENFFYITTTTNNTFPSLHVALSILIVKAIKLTDNKRYFYFAGFTAAMVIIAVLYLTIHWLMDVLTGILLAVIVIVLLEHILKE